MRLRGRLADEVEASSPRVWARARLVKLRTRDIWTVVSSGKDVVGGPSEVVGVSRGLMFGRIWLSLEI